MLTHLQRHGFRLGGEPGRLVQTPEQHRTVLGPGGRGAGDLMELVPTPGFQLQAVA